MSNTTTKTECTGKKCPFLATTKCPAKDCPYLQNLSADDVAAQAKGCPYLANKCPHFSGSSGASKECPCPSSDKGGCPCTQPSKPKESAGCPCSDCKCASGDKSGCTCGDCKC